MNMQGNAHVYGDNINTDLIIAGKYTKTIQFEELAVHCMEDLDPQFAHRVKTGDFVVAGQNFGCGSSREQAPLALKYSGVQAVLARSFARIFFRNAINVGLPVIICDTDAIRQDDDLKIDMQNGVLLINQRERICFQQLSPIMQSILAHGGLASFLKEKGDFVL